MTASSRPDATSDMRIVPSQLPDSKRLLSAENNSLLPIPDECPRKMWCGRPDAVFQIRTVESCQPPDEASHFPSGEKASVIGASVWPKSAVSGNNDRPVANSQR